MSEEKPQNVRFRFNRGDSWPPFSFKLIDENGDTIPLSGVEILMQLKVRRSDSEAVREYTHISGFVIEGDVASLDIKNIDTSELLPKSYVFDIQVSLPNGIIRTIYDGSVSIVQDVSR